ncbi:MAG: hypothetical protein K2F63_05645, partial [Muribaculaceae bacterium]|nr:hypothetical protein [Muribaculaceae bacterium]
VYKIQGQSHNSHAASQNRTVADNTFGVQADYSHEFDNGSVLTAMADYMHSGLKSPSTALRSAPLSDLGLPGAAPFTVATLDRAQKQNIDAFAASVAYSTHNTPVALSATAYVDHFALGKDIVSPLDIIPESRFSPARQTRFGLDASASGKISGGAGYAFRLDAGFMDGRDRLTERTMGIIGLNPALTFSYSHINARLGARMDISVNSPDQTFHGSPDIYFGWQPSGRLGLYASLGGGERFNTLRRLYNYSPFAPGAQTFRNSFTPVDGRAGFVAGSFGGVTAEIYVRYCAARRLPMPVLTDQGLSFELTNLSGWSAGLRLDYTFSDKIKAGAYADFYPHSYASGVPDALDRASVCAGMSVSVLVMQDLTLDASYDLRRPPRKS